jgi:hypothetical protein
MDSTLPPTDQTIPPPLPYAKIYGPLASANQLWLHRTYVGIGGLALAQIIVIVQAGGMILNLVAARGDNRPLMELFTWTLHLEEVAYSVRWFSALYLLALAHYSGEEDPFRLLRKLLLSVGGAFLIIRFIPMMMLPIYLARAVPIAAEVMEIAAIVTLFLYLMKIAELANHAFLKMHLPIALVLIILRHGLAAILGDRINGEDLRLLMMLASAAYWFYLMLQMRAMLAKLTFTSSTPEP